MENANPKNTAGSVLSSSYSCPPFDSQKPQEGPTAFTEIIVLGDNLSNLGKQYSCQQNKLEALEEFNIKQISTANDDTNDNVFQEASLQQMEWKTPYQKHPTESTASINNFSKIVNSKCKTEKPNKIAVKHTFLNNSELDACKYPQPPQEGKNVPISAAMAHGKKVRFNKGVLKNQSEYRPVDSPWKNNFTFPKNLASMIRDSIELTKVKNNELCGNNKIILKGLEFEEEQMKENDINNHREDQRLHHNRVSGLSRLDAGLTPPASTGHHFATQAWTDVGLQVPLHGKMAQEVSGGSKTPQRKGTIDVQSRSATECNQIARTQGRNIISHPARRMTPEEKSTGLDRTPSDEQISHIWHSVRSALTPQHGNVCCA